MFLVGITACTAGIAHTYLCKEKLLRAAQQLGHTCRIETQGSIGIEDALTAKEIADADVVLIAADINIAGRERFAGKKIVEVPMRTVVKSPKALLQKIEEKLNA